MQRPDAVINYSNDERGIAKRSRMFNDCSATTRADNQTRGHVGGQQPKLDGTSLHMRNLRVPIRRRDPSLPSTQQSRNCNVVRRGAPKKRRVVAPPSHNQQDHHEQQRDAERCVLGMDSNTRADLWRALQSLAFVELPLPPFCDRHRLAPAKPTVCVCVCG